MTRSATNVSTAAVLAGGLPLADVTVAVAAEASGLPVLHFDRDFDRLGAILGISTRWLADPATA